jgi:UDP-GlcNAc:undecaprenyl-phosphate/decaprenyl-phosphate GlcNAc-1-phosphate transferase
MNLSRSDYFLLFAASFSLVGILTPLMRRVALTYGVIDTPTEAHKTHKHPIPYLGGVAIVLGVFVVSYGASLLSNFSASTFWLASSVLVPAFLMSIVGLIDDIRRLSPWSRFLVQNAIGVFSAVVLVSTETIGSPTGWSILDVALTVFWIVGLTNAINFFDNLDGGASGTVAISSAFLFLLAFQNEQILISALALVLTGATLGFLIWNRPPARIYMGDAGALFLGLLLASLTIRLEPNPINKWASFTIPIFLVAIPILDTSVVVIKRLLRGTSPFQGGRDHLSHRLVRLGLSKRQAVISLWLLTFFFGALAFLISNSSYQKEGLITIFGAIIWVLSFIFFAKQADL